MNGANAAIQNQQLTAALMRAGAEIKRLRQENAELRKQLEAVVS